MTLTWRERVLRVSPGAGQRVLRAVGRGGAGRGGSDGPGQGAAGAVGGRGVRRAGGLRLRGDTHTSLTANTSFWVNV